ncbi:MAG: riboflavin biosynthesis protein RibF [Pirellulaceae bacterium]|jgi:riboflavin kinase/FMN adenylyltransferase|nr:riboflavin biosynthesis protein RibF [Pirellulaceae bacterium]
MARLIRDLDNLPADLRSGAVSVGNFDGVHLGHARLIERLVACARRVRGPAVVWTFDPHPACVLTPAAAPPPLTSSERKTELLGLLGVEAVVACPATRDVLSLSPQDFFDRMLRQRLDVRAMVEGPNFFFGRQRSGSIDTLTALCEAAGVALEVVAPVLIDGQCISSSWIRELIQAGDVSAADRLLTQPYRLSGTVVRGAGRGAQLGFATANIEPAGMVLPPLGVYAGRGWHSDTAYAAAIHLGPNPTFGESHVKFEVHLVGYDQPLYGATLSVDFLARLREIRSFSDTQALQQQLQRDVAAASRIAGESAP